MSEEKRSNCVRKDILITILICIIVIVGLLFVWAISRSTDPQFASEFSFAATISSIILSIIAIIMSITSEAKTESIRRSIKKEVRKLDGAIAEMEKMTEEQKQNAKNMQNRINTLEKKVDDIQSDTHFLVLNKEKKDINTTETLDPLIRNIGVDVEEDGDQLKG